nr:hypothetical protein [Tanacetum cinerariifolium]
MTWDDTGKCTKPGKIQNPIDGKAWKDFDTKYSDFAAKPRNVRLGLAADGFNPFGKLSQSYSMCFKSLGKDVDVYWRPLIDYLKDLWSGQGYKASPTCNEDTPSGKIAYVGHKRFLKKPHKRRRLLEFNGETENRDPSREFSRDAIMTQLARLPTRVNGKHPSCDERRPTQSSGICSPGPDGEMYYGQLEQILEFSYVSFKTVLFRVKWFDTSNKGRIQNFVIRNNITQIKANGDAFKNDQYILTAQVKQCFYLEDMARRPPDVDAPPDIIDVIDEDDDIIDKEDPIPHDLADSDDEDLVNHDIDDGVNMSTNIARGHGGDGGGDDHPPLYQVLPGQGTVIPPPSQSTHSADIARIKKHEKLLTKQVNMFMRLFRSDDKFSQMLTQLESQPEYGGGSGSGGCGDDELGDNEDGGEDEEEDDDS